MEVELLSENDINDLTGRDEDEATLHGLQQC